MAQLLYDKQSSEAHLNAVKRHMRLCRQISGGEPYALQIEPYYQTLTEKRQASDQAKFEREAAYDLVVLNDSDLDNTLRTLFEKAKQYDRENPGRPVLTRLFIDGKLSGIIYASLKNEPQLAEQLIARLDALGEDHPLAEEKAKVQADVDKCQAALTAYQETIITHKSVVALEEIAQADLRRQYEFNYLDIAKEFGKSYANRFFPSFRSSPKITPEEDIQEPEITE